MESTRFSKRQKNYALIIFVSILLLIQLLSKANLYLLAIILIATLCITRKKLQSIVVGCILLFYVILFLASHKMHNMNVLRFFGFVSTENAKETEIDKSQVIESEVSNLPVYHQPEEKDFIHMTASVKTTNVTIENSTLYPSQLSYSDEKIQSNDYDKFINKNILNQETNTVSVHTISMIEPIATSNISKGHEIQAIQNLENINEEVKIMEVLELENHGDYNNSIYNQPSIINNDVLLSNKINDENNLGLENSIQPNYVLTPHNIKQVESNDKKGRNSTYNDKNEKDKYEKYKKTSDVIENRNEIGGIRKSKTNKSANSSLTETNKKVNKLKKVENKIKVPKNYIYISDVFDFDQMILFDIFLNANAYNVLENSFYKALLYKKFDIFRQNIANIFISYDRKEIEIKANKSAIFANYHCKKTDLNFVLKVMKNANIKIKYIIVGDINNLIKVSNLLKFVIPCKKKEKHVYENVMQLTKKHILNTRSLKDFRNIRLFYKM